MVKIQNSIDAAKELTPEPWGKPDMSVMQEGRRPAPEFPLDVLGRQWNNWVQNAAEGAAAPVDYVAATLLVSASALIGNARWVRATPGWREPPNLWCGLVGDSGSSKTPGMQTLLRAVLPKIETKMGEDYPERLKEWQLKAEVHKAETDAWKSAVRKAVEEGGNPPSAPDELEPMPEIPRLIQNDVTIEKAASLLTTAAPKGLMMVRDEFAGFVAGMNNYNDGGRAFWLESWNGGPYRVERKSSPIPLFVPHLTFSMLGGIQPEKQAEMMRDADDGFLARLIFVWPEQQNFKLGRGTPDIEYAVQAFDRLRKLKMEKGAGPDEAEEPINVPLTDNAANRLEAFGQAMQRAQQDAGGKLRSAYGKTRGHALRLSLVLEFLRWSGDLENSRPPRVIGEQALNDACNLMEHYFMHMAQRVYGDAAIPEAERNAATLARWIAKYKPQEVHVTTMVRQVRLPGLREPATIKSACEALVEADWLRRPDKGGWAAKAKVSYPVNPAIWDGKEATLMHNANIAFIADMPGSSSINAINAINAPPIAAPASGTVPFATAMRKRFGKPETRQ